METGKAKLEKVETTDRFVSVRDFTDLETWQIARELRKGIYRVCKSFPREEMFGLTSQLKRAAISITANIAEGFGRFSYQENIQSCRQSRGSVYEVCDHLTAALDAGFLSTEKFDELNTKAISVVKLLNGYIRATTLRKNSKGMSH